MRINRSWPTRVQEFFTSDGIVPLAREERIHVRSSVKDIDSSDPTVPSGYRPPPNNIVRAYYDTCAPNYDQIVAASYDREVSVTSYIAHCLARLQPSRVVEGGCATGLTLAFLATVFPETTFTGYDISPEMIVRTTQRIRAHALQNVTLVVMSHEHAPEYAAANRADVLFTKRSFSTGKFPVVSYEDCDGCLTWDECWEGFYANDPTMRGWRETLSAFNAIIRPRGWYLHIGTNCAGGIRMLIDVAKRAGFRFHAPWSMAFAYNKLAPSSMCADVVAQFGECYGIGQLFSCALVFRKEL